MSELNDGPKEPTQTTTNQKNLEESVHKQNEQLGNKQNEPRKPSKRRSKSTVTPPDLNLPEVSALDRESAVQLLRARRPPARGTRNVQNVLQQLVGGPKKSGAPCGQCECCKSLLSYVTVLRNFMDHVVSGMSEGSVAESKPHCALCSVHPVEHVVFPSKEEATVQQDTITVGAKDEIKLLSTNSTQARSKNIQNSRGAPPSKAIDRQPHQHHPQPTNQNTKQQKSVQSKAQPPTPLESKSQDDGARSIIPTLGGNDLVVTSPSPQAYNLSPGISYSPPSHNIPGPNTPAALAHSLAPSTVLPSSTPQSATNAAMQTTSKPVPNTPVLPHSDPNTPVLPPSDPNTPVHATPPSGTGTTHCPSVPPTPLPPQKVPLIQTSSARPPATLSGGSTGEEPARQFESIPWTTYKKDYERPSHHQDPETVEANEDVSEEEAFITLAQDNASALACLVLGNSLVLSATSKTLVVLVTDSVSSSMRTVLSTVFDYVQTIDQTSPGYTALALLEEPDVGITFTKILLWGLEQFPKGVFLDPNTLVVQNCDELFDREEFSAAADIGWPDCFNTDVFVFSPSLDTFWRLAKYAENQSRYDGGDQGLMNSYFNNWCRDISKKLPFIYNLRANVSYTYKPAFKHFGSQVKIVNFFGSYKPMDVRFHSATGQMAADANVHPTFAQFVYYWLEIFTKRVLPLLPEDSLPFLKSHQYVCAHDFLKFFPSPQLGTENLPTPPSFRVYPSSTLEWKRITDESSDDPPEEEAVGSEVTSSGLPGTRIGNYDDMRTWEKGQMDYLGQHKSDTILARLDYFIQGKTENES